VPLGYGSFKFFLINTEILSKCLHLHEENVIEIPKFVRLGEVEREKLFGGTEKKRLAVASEAKVQLWVVLVPRLNAH
jgi:hypothetical protein